MEQEDEEVLSTLSLELQDISPTSTIIPVTLNDEYPQLNEVTASSICSQENQKSRANISLTLDHTTPLSARQQMQQTPKRTPLGVISNTLQNKQATGVATLKSPLGSGKSLNDIQDSSLLPQIRESDTEWRRNHTYSTESSILSRQQALDNQSMETHKIIKRQEEQLKILQEKVFVFMFYM